MSSPFLEVPLGGVISPYMLRLSLHTNIGCWILKENFSVYANNKYSFKGGITVQPNDADTIASAIMMYGPVEAAFTVYSDFEEYTCGIYQKNSTAESEGGHAVKIVGWGEENGVKYWKVQNSWNPTWGEAGYFRIIKGVNECAIESQVTSSSPKAQWIGPDGYLTQRSSNILWPAEALS
eukprot:gb/GEZN01016505.1/.p1 GENE.gb/GEZN01016505.1/~~gb/GEZN01016505.1/.p1  ORF type:complete len:179 (-),score=15.35 gb/GEZN01016505.1/:101-637(-)